MIYATNDYLVGKYKAFPPHLRKMCERWTQVHESESLFTVVCGDTRVQRLESAEERQALKDLWDEMWANECFDEVRKVYPKGDWVEIDRSNYTGYHVPYDDEWWDNTWCGKVGDDCDEPPWYCRSVTVAGNCYYKIDFAFIRRDTSVPSGEPTVVTIGRAAATGHPVTERSLWSLPIWIIGNGKNTKSGFNLYHVGASFREKFSPATGLGAIKSRFKKTFKKFCGDSP